MKKGLLRLITVSAVFVLGAFLTINHNVLPSKVEATPYLEDYAAYSYSGNYYNTIDFSKSDGMNGDLRKDVTSLIVPKGFYTYGSQGETHLATQLQYADEDPNDSTKMIYLYTRDSVNKNAASSWNREHVWPQSNSNNNWGTDRGGADILHIRPTYNKTNETRGNTKYGDNNKSGPEYYNNMLFAYTGGSYFEPIDAVKGDVARIIMYLWTAYNGYPGYNSLNILNVFQSYDVLLKWHTQDKPDALEGNRNNYAESSIQKNRNPFVDHPELAWRFFGDNASSSVKSACMTAYPSTGYVPNEKSLTKIEISGQATKREYTAGQSFDPTGLTVTGTYDDGSTTNISVNNCTWSPSPLTVGTTSITCTYGQLTTTYSGITVTKRIVSDKVFNVVFKSDTDGSSEYTSGSSVFNAELEENTLIKSIDSVSKVFRGEKGLKLGSSKQTGSITFSLVDEAKDNIEKITIETQKYGSDSSEVTFKLDNNIIKSNINPGTDYVGIFNDISASKITISTNQKRAYLVSVTVEIGEEDPDPQPSSSSSQPISSSEGPISSSESSSSGEPSSIPSSEESSSSEIESTSESSEELISSEIDSSQASSEEQASSESSNIPEPQESSEQSSASTPEESSSVNVDSSISSSNSSSEAQPKKTGGCNGSLLATLSLTSFTALIGLAFIAFKKKF